MYRHLLIFLLLSIILLDWVKGESEKLNSSEKTPIRRMRPPAGNTNIGFGSLLSGLLGTITHTAETSDCPGKCIHALASLVCDQVLEEVQCPSSSLRCCVERRGKFPSANSTHNSNDGSTTTRTTTPSSTTTATTPTPQISTPTLTAAAAQILNTIPSSNPSSSSTTTTATTTSTTTTSTTTMSTTTVLAQRVDTKVNVPIYKVDNTQENEETFSSNSADSTSSETCPGVCVAERLSSFCEAILNIEELCKPSLRCCVAKRLFSNGNAPPELLIPNKEYSSLESSTNSPPPPPTTALSTKSPSAPCRGTCVTGFFALLCDEIDRNIVCPGNGRCCITKKTNSPSLPSPPTHQAPERKCPGVCIPQMMSSFCNRPSVLIKDDTFCEKGTICCNSKGNERPTEISEPLEDLAPQRTPSAPQRTPSAPPSPPPSQPQSRPSSPDLTQLFLNVAPALLNAATGNSDAGQTAASLLPILAPVLGSILGGSSNAPSAPPKNSGSQSLSSSSSGFPSLAQSILPALASTFLGSPARPPSPPPTTVTTTTTTTTTTTERADPRPECPGTCIGPYLSFTCFGNAAITNLFKCEKKKSSCCSPKADIKDRESQLHFANRIPDRRNDSVFGTHFEDEYESGFYEPQSQLVSQSVSQHKYPFPTNTIVERPRLDHPITNKYVCGVKGTFRSGRVVGGEDASPGEWCWQVALINSLNQYLCGGALIGTQWVLTAAHCVTNIVRAGDSIYVRVGDHDLTQKFGSPGAQTLRVATTYIHHNHNSQTLDNDIAILKLHGEADLKDGVCLVCLPARGTSQHAGKLCTVTGYGYMGESGPIPLRVREAKVPVVNDNECVRKINAVTEKIFILPASSFCAGGIQGHDACQGDGGGPMVCEDDGYYELTGLVSWGFGCGRQDVPGVYVKISSFIGWINQIISVNNNNNNNV